MTRRSCIVEFDVTPSALSSPRTRGPITTGGCCYERVSTQVAQELRPVVMGPGSRSLTLACPGRQRGIFLASRILLRRIGRDRCRGGAILHSELGIDLLEVLVDGARTQAQDLRDIAVGLALGQPRQHFALAGRKSKFAREIGGSIRGGVL